MLMGWHRWIAAYMIIIGAIVFWVLPNKSWMVYLAVIGLMGGGYLIMHIPRKSELIETEKKEDG